MMELEKNKTYYFIDEDGSIWLDNDYDSVMEIKKKHIGNYFENEKEVRDAYKKLIAWRRLKEAGFKIRKYETKGGKKKDKVQGSFIIYADCEDFVPEKDLDLLFGGEE